MNLEQIEMEIVKKSKSGFTRRDCRNEYATIENIVEVSRILEKVFGHTYEDGNGYDYSMTEKNFFSNKDDGHAYYATWSNGGYCILEYSSEEGEYIDNWFPAEDMEEAQEIMELWGVPFLTQDA